ncbi:hypothetical protein B296_00020166 [Ensete ventricosum]|uniref:Uncharacterized protein n=1 Tax=Ensete ventricosum TaxID=4639 RepID=A0A426Z2M7_ENSVE|nr:hypothetical protein B296_00020166 [Ensete ventricosum]
MVLGTVRVMEIGYDDYILRLEGYPKDVVVGGSKIGRVLVYEKKNDKEDRPLRNSMGVPSSKSSKLSETLLKES